MHRFLDGFMVSMMAVAIFLMVTLFYISTTESMVAKSCDNFGKVTLNDKMYVCHKEDKS